MLRKLLTFVLQRRGSPSKAKSVPTTHDRLRAVQRDGEIEREGHITVAAKEARAHAKKELRERLDVRRHMALKFRCSHEFGLWAGDYLSWYAGERKVRACQSHTINREQSVNQLFPLFLVRRLYSSRSSTARRRMASRMVEESR